MRKYSTIYEKIATNSNLEKYEYFSYYPPSSEVRDVDQHEAWTGRAQRTDEEDSS